MSDEGWDQVLRQCQQDIERYQRELNELRQRPIHQLSASNERLNKQQQLNSLFPAHSTENDSSISNSNPTVKTTATQVECLKPKSLSTGIQSEEDFFVGHTAVKPLLNHSSNTTTTTATSSKPSKHVSFDEVEPPDKILEYEQLRLLSSRQALEIRSLVEQQQLLRRENGRLVRENLLWKRFANRDTGDRSLALPAQLQLIEPRDLHSAVLRFSESLLGQLQQLEKIGLNEQSTSQTPSDLIKSRLGSLRKFVEQQVDPEVDNADSPKRRVNPLHSMQRLQDLIEEIIPGILDSLELRMSRRAVVENPKPAPVEPASSSKVETAQATKISLLEQHLLSRDGEISRLRDEIETLRTKLTAVGHERRHSASVGETARMRELQSQLDNALRENKLLQITTGDLKNILSSSTRAPSPVAELPRASAAATVMASTNTVNSGSLMPTQSIPSQPSSGVTITAATLETFISPLVQEAERILSQHFADEEDLDRLYEWVEEHIRFAAGLKYKLQQSTDRHRETEEQLAHRQRELESTKMDLKAAQETLIEYEEQFSRLLPISLAAHSVGHGGGGDKGGMVPLLKLQFPAAIKSHPLPFFTHFEYTAAAHQSVAHAQAYSKSQLQQAQQLTDQLQKRCRELSAELQTAVDHSASKEQEVQELNKRLATLSSALDSLNSQYKEIVNQKLANEAKLLRISEGFAKMYL